jgi:hypothetical protein
MLGLPHRGDVKSILPIVLVLASTAAIGAGVRPITLQYKPAGRSGPPAPAMSAALTSRTLSLDVVDARNGAEPEIVGAQRAGGKLVYEWRARNPVAEAVAAAAGEVLRGWSMNLAGDADLSLALKLTRYDVTETALTFGSAYHAEVGLTGTLVARGGEVVWSGEALGEAKRSGADGRPGICNELLSRALEQALGRLLGSIEIESAPATGSIVTPIIEPPAAAPPPPTGLTPAKLLDEIIKLQSGGVGDDVLVAFVKQQQLDAPLTADDVLLWKQKGIPEAAIAAALGTR